MGLPGYAIDLTFRAAGACLDQPTLRVRGLRSGQRLLPPLLGAANALVAQLGDCVRGCTAGGRKAKGSVERAAASTLGRFKDISVAEGRWLVEKSKRRKLEPGVASEHSCAFGHSH